MPRPFIFLKGKNEKSCSPPRLGGGLGQGARRRSGIFLFLFFLFLVVNEKSCSAMLGGRERAHWCQGTGAGAAWAGQRETAPLVGGKVGNKVF